MVCIMQKAANIDEEASNQDQEQLCRLTTENKVYFDIIYHMYYHVI